MKISSRKNKSPVPELPPPAPSPTELTNQRAVWPFKYIEQPNPSPMDEPSDEEVLRRTSLGVDITYFEVGEDDFEID